MCVVCILSLVLLSQEFFDFQERHQSSVLAMLVRKYHGIGPLVIKVEGLVELTNTGQSERLSQYYQYWEKRMFDSLVKASVCVCMCVYMHVCIFLCVRVYMYRYAYPLLFPQMVVSNLKYYCALLESGQPLFTVETLLTAPEIVLHPHANELSKMMLSTMKDVVEG